MSRTTLTRKVGAVAALLAVMLLSACDTQPATNVGGTSATLNAKGACTAGTSGQWWFQLRDVTRGGGWYDATARVGYSCSQNSGEVNFQPQGVGGLDMDTLYQFRLATTVNGSFYWWDANGQQNGTNYDSFRTKFVSGRETQTPDPGDTVEPCTPDSPDDACSSADNIRRKKNPLRNRFVWTQCVGCWFLEQDISEHMSFLDWSFNLTTKNIRKIYQRTHEVNCLANVGSCKAGATYWRVAECDRTGPDTCLFRSEGWAEYSLVIRGVTSTRQLISCLGTRINWDGSHVRHAFEGRCSTIASARARTSGDVSDRALSIGGVPVGRYLTRAEMRAFDRACIGREADKRGCRRAGDRLYDSLPKRVQKKIEVKTGTVRP
jgi:hypothetical protein